jgi:hypothetical protein
MRIFVDIFSGDEIICDSYNMVYMFNDVGCKVQSRLLVKDEKFDVYSAGTEFANPDAAEEGVKDEPVKVIDVMDTYNYQETGFQKKDYGTYIKGYIGKVLAHLTENKPQRVEAFKAGAKEMVGWILSKFEDFTFYTPQSYDSDNSIILSYFEPGSEAPTFVYFVDGLRGEKC